MASIHREKSTATEQRVERKLLIGIFDIVNDFEHHQVFIVGLCYLLSAVYLVQMNAMIALYWYPIHIYLINEKSHFGTQTYVPRRKFVSHYIFWKVCFSVTKSRNGILCWHWNPWYNRIRPPISLYTIPTHQLHNLWMFSLCLISVFTQVHRSAIYLISAVLWDFQVCLNDVSIFKFNSEV